MKQKIFVASIMIICVIVMFGCAALIGYDYATGTKHSYMAQIVNKQHKPKESRMEYNLVLKRWETKITPAKWELVVKGEFGTRTISVKESVYKDFELGEQVILYMQISSLTGTEHNYRIVHQE